MHGIIQSKKLWDYTFYKLWDYSINWLFLWDEKHSINGAITVEWGYEKSSSYVRMFHNKPSSYWGSTYGNPPYLSG